MENFRAKQYENFNFEGEVFSGDGECDYCADYIKELKKDRDRYFKLWIWMGIAWVITMIELIILAFSK